MSTLWIPGDGAPDLGVPNVRLAASAEPKIAQATQTSYVFNKDTSLSVPVQPGELVVVAIDLASNAGIGGVSAPSGWNLDNSFNTTTSVPSSMGFWSKVFDGTEPDTHTWTFTSVTTTVAVWDWRCDPGIWVPNAHRTASQGGSITNSSSISSPGGFSGAVVANKEVIICGLHLSGARTNFSFAGGTGTWVDIGAGSKITQWGHMLPTASTTPTVTASWTTSATKGIGVGVSYLAADT